MNEPRKLRPVTIEGPFRSVPVEEWAERHRRASPGKGLLRTVMYCISTAV